MARGNALVPHPHPAAQAGPSGAVFSSKGSNTSSLVRRKRGGTDNTPYLSQRNRRSIHPRSTRGRCFKKETHRKTTETFASGGRGKQSLSTIPLRTGTATWTLGTRDKAPRFPRAAFWRLPGTAQPAASGVSRSNRGVTSTPRPRSRRKTGGRVWAGPARACVRVTSARARSLAPP